MPTYSYNPTKASENGLDKMRLELGDTTFAPGELTAALSDEEYLALINTHKKWQKAKIACLRAILMRFSHQVNTSISGVSYSFAERVKFWKELYEEEKAKEANAVVPSVNTDYLSGVDGGHYFREDLHKNW